MNAVIDTTRLPSGKYDPNTTLLAKLSEASAGCQQILAQTQSLRKRTSERLREQLNQMRLQTGLTITNPDAIFFTVTDEKEEDSFVSKGMTDLLIDTLRGQMPFKTFSGCVFYTRHKTLDQNYALTTDQNQSVEGILNAMMPTVFRDYEAYLNGVWGQMVTHPGNPQQTDEAYLILRALQREALECEIELNVLTRAMSPLDSLRLLSVIAGEPGDGVYNVSYVAKNGARIDLYSTYVVTQSSESTDESSGTVFLVMPCKGIERFESIYTLREALSVRLYGEDRDPHLVAAMPLSDQGRWSADRPVGADAWRFLPVSTSVVSEHLQWVHMKQVQDFAYLVEQPALDADTWHQHVERVQTCAHMDDAMAYRFNLLSVITGEFLAPDWLKNVNKDDRIHLLKLEQNQRVHKRQVAKRLSGVESFAGFVHDQLTTYIQDNLGCLIDPNHVTVTLEDAIPLAGGDKLQANYVNTLLEFAVRGLLGTSGEMSFAPAANHLHADFSEAFVKGMIKDLDLHHGYAEALREAYKHEESVRQMVIHSDSLIAFSAFTAKMKGHLIQNRSHEMLINIRGDKHKDGSTYSVGSLYLKDTYSRFNDVIVFEDKTQADEHFVLYAPGAPNDRDFFEFESWRALCFAVGEWMASESGRSYVDAQLNGPLETGHSAVIESIYTNPSLHGVGMCLFKRCDAATFEGNIADLVSQKVSRTLQAAELVVRYDHKHFASISNQAQLTARVDALNTAFLELSPKLVDFRTFAHQTITTALNERIRKNKFLPHMLDGSQIDPDTIYISLNAHYTTDPDFSTLYPLVDLAMDGSKDIESWLPLVYAYSSTGLSRDALFSSHFIRIVHQMVRDLDVGTQYIDFLKQNFLNRQSPDYALLKSVMASRIEYEMSCAALREFLQGNLSDDQYSWVRRTSIGLNNSSVGSKTTAVSAFQIDGQVIEGVYIFREFGKTDPDYNLLYTPNAPDGRSFRHLSDYATLLSSPQMQNYFYSRVVFDGRKRINTFIEDLVRGKKNDADFIRIVNRMENRIPNAEQLYGDMLERIILDVDAQNKSKTEIRIATAWTVVQFLGDLLLLPFPAAKIAWGVFTSAVKIYQGADAYMSGDRSTGMTQVLLGVFGVLSKGRAARQLYDKVQLARAGLGDPVGVWVWNSLDFEKKAEKTFSEYFLKKSYSVISDLASSAEPDRR